MAEKSEPTKEELASVRQVAGLFARDVPPAARQSGVWHIKDGGPHAEHSVNAPNGIYRVVGSDWLVTINKKRLVQAARAKPPHFGGDNVIAVPND